LSDVAAHFAPKAFVAIIANTVNSTVPIGSEVFEKRNVYDLIFGVTSARIVRANTFNAEANDEAIVRNRTLFGVRRVTSISAHRCYSTSSSDYVSRAELKEILDVALRPLKEENNRLRNKLVDALEKLLKVQEVLRLMDEGVCDKKLGVEVCDRVRRAALHATEGTRRESDEGEPVVRVSQKSSGWKRTFLAVEDRTAGNNA